MYEELINAECTLISSE